MEKLAIEWIAALGIFLQEELIEIFFLNPFVIHKLSNFFTIVNVNH